MKHYIRQKTDNSIQYTRHLIHKPRSIVLSKGHLTRNTFKSNIFMLINKLIVKFYVHGSLGVLQSWYLAYWWVSNCFFHELSYVKSLDFGPTFFVVIFNVICLTINNLSGILDTTDTSFVHPWLFPPPCEVSPPPPCTPPLLGLGPPLGNFVLLRRLLSSLEFPNWWNIVMQSMLWYVLRHSDIQ